MKNIFRHSVFFAVLLSMVASSCADRADKSVPRSFRNEVVLKTTPVKDQGSSELCWAYAMLATIETERLEMGDSVNLSPDYLPLVVAGAGARLLSHAWQGGGVASRHGADGVEAH